MKKKVAVFAGLVAAMLTVCALPAAAFVPYESYNYNSWGESVPMPLTYTPVESCSGPSLGTDAFLSPTDLYFDGETLYVLDAGNARILKLDPQLRLMGTVENEKLTGGTGLHVTPDGQIYIACRDAGEVLLLSDQGETLHAFGKPVSEEIPDNLAFRPSRVVSGGNVLYIVCEGSFQGMLETDLQGNFLAFFGGNRVDVTQEVLVNMFWKRLFSKEQRENMENSVPIEYSSLDIDDRGFLYAVTAESKNSMNEIKKLDPKGNNILRVKSSDDMMPGVKLNIGNYGDIETGYDRGQTVDTRFIDIKADDDGFLYVLDGQRGRVFQYDDESNLLCIFGGLGEQEGLFREPVAVENIGDRVLVLDKQLGEILVFEPTALGRNIRQAVGLYNEGYYEQSLSLWQEISRQTANYELANIGIGKALYSQGDYTGAMRYYRLAYDKKGYDEAYKEYRREAVRQNFGWLIGGAVLCIVALAAAVHLVHRYHPVARLIRSRRYLPVSYYVGKPFRASDDVRMYDQGQPWMAIILVALLALSRILTMCSTGFLFNDRRMEDIRALDESVLIFVIYGGFLLCNWAVSTLMDGEGRPRDVAVVCGYALVPAIVGNVAGMLLSNVLALREEGLLTLISLLSVAFSGWLFFVGLMTVHRFSVARTLGNLLLSAIGMVLLAFLLFLVYGLFNQMMVFLSNIFTEFTLRL